MKTPTHLFYSFLHTQASWAPLIARLALAITFFPHGAQKVFGWFDGRGFTATMNLFTNTMHIPTPLALLAVATEFLAPLGLLIGLGTRLAALGLAGNMAVAAALVHAPNGFFMNWHNTQKGEGVEFHVLAVSLALALVVLGGGRLSLDRALAARLTTNGRDPGTLTAAAPRVGIAG